MAEPRHIDVQSDLTPIIQALILPITRTLRDKLDDVDLTSEAWWEITGSLVDAAAAGVRIGAAEIAGSLDPHGIRVHVDLHYPADGNRTE